MASGGGAAGVSASLLARGELSAMEQLLDQPVAIGWDIVVSGSALQACRPHGSLLARAHHAINMLGGSLTAGLTELEAAHRALRGVHCARG